MKTKPGLLRSLLMVLFLLPATHAWAVFVTLTVVTQGGGLITTNPTAASYPLNSTITLTATPSNGWYFAGWSGAAGGTTNSVNVFMSGNLTVTGTFLAYPQYSLTVTTNGQGSIGLNPPGANFYSNTVVSLTATPASGWVFTGWSGTTNSVENPLTWVEDANASLAANFAELPAFTVQPQGITNMAGSTVSFTPSVAGSGTLAYQWYFNNSPLSGDTGATLTLTNTTLGEAGFYDLVVTNAYGSVTSSLVALVITNLTQSTNVVSVCNESTLQAAIAAGGWISIGCSSTIVLTNTLTITNNVILDGSQVSATISGGNAVRLFSVMPGGALSITNLTLANGLSLVTNGSSPADAGAIYNNGGTVTLTACTLTNNMAFFNNSAFQGDNYGGTARGGAIFNNGGVICVYGSFIQNNTAFGANPSLTTGGYSFGVGGGFGFGGAVFNTNGSVTIVNSLIQNNVCTNLGGSGNPACIGGALAQASGTLFLTNDILTANQASAGATPDGSYPPAAQAYGGGLGVLGGSVFMNQCRWAGNTAKGGDGTFDNAAGASYGGAVYNLQTMTAVSCSFAGNQSLAGNGNCIDNFPPPDGGLGGAIYNLGQIVLKNCLVCSNLAQGGTDVRAGTTGVATGGDGLGGGIFNGAQISATNCTIALNSAVAALGTFNSQSGIVTNGNAFGGGLYNNTNAVFLGVNVTIASNLCNATAANPVQGSGISTRIYTNGIAAGSQIASTNGTVELLNSLLDDGSTNDNACGTITDLGYNMSSDGSANFNSGTSFNNTDPLLEALANNGGPTLTMALNPNSPAIAYANSAGAPPDDQRGYARPAGTGVIDLGAYQSGATQIYTPPPTAPVVSVCDGPDLQAAVTAGGWIGIGCSGTIVLTNTMMITNNVILDGSSVSAVISGNSLVPLFNVAAGASLSITNLTLANGSSVVASGSTPACGGAIQNYGGTVILTGCTLTNNSAYASGDSVPAQGGAIYNNSGTMVLLNSSVSNNVVSGGSSSGGQNGPIYSSSGQGGAIYNTNGTITLSQCRLTGNFCSDAGGGAASSGGALYQASGSLTASNCLFATNVVAGGAGIFYDSGEGITPSGPGYGGAVAVAGGSAAINFCQFAGNSALGGSGGVDSPSPMAHGGAVYSAGTVTVAHSSFYGNQALAGSGETLNTDDAACGGAIGNAGSLRLDDCSIWSNHVQGCSASVYRSSSEIGGDGLGGGIYNNSQMWATNCTVAYNYTLNGAGISGGANGRSFGGGVYNSGTAALLAVNVTVAGNTCRLQGAGPAGGAEIANTNGSLSLLNSLVAYGGSSNVWGSVTDLGYNMNSDATASFNSGTSFNNTDPLLGSLANNGGPSLTMDLLSGSPAIAYANSSGAPPDDQRGYLRPTGTAVIDLGAYQSNGTPVSGGSPAITMGALVTGTNVIVSFTLSAAITNTVHLQTSTNLTVWTDYATYATVTGTTNVSVPFSTQGAARQFFRLWW